MFGCLVTVHLVLLQSVSIGVWLLGQCSFGIITVLVFGCLVVIYWFNCMLGDSSFGVSLFGGS